MIRQVNKVIEYGYEHDEYMIKKLKYSITIVITTTEPCLISMGKTKISIICKTSNPRAKWSKIWTSGWGGCMFSAHTCVMN